MYTITDAACLRAMRRRGNDDAKDLIVIDQLMALIDDDGCDQWLFRCYYNLLRGCDELLMMAKIGKEKRTNDR